MSNPISHRAMMVALTQRAWKGTAIDRDVAAHAEQSMSAEHGSMTVIKELCPKHITLPIKNAMSVGRQEHYKHTIPGLLKGQFLLPTAMFETYAATQSAVKDEFDMRVKAFLKIYPDIVDRASKRLGSAFKASDFPTVERMKAYFEYRVLYMPVPDVADWRLDGISEADTEAIRKEVEESVNGMYAKATEEIFERARAMLQNIYNQASNYTMDCPAATLRDNSVENMRELSSLVCSMNITGDPKLDQLGKEMLKEFADLQGAELRKSADRRAEIAAKAKSLLGKYTGVKRAA